jgi:hypothetical protein
MSINVQSRSRKHVKVSRKQVKQCRIWAHASASSAGQWLAWLLWLLYQLPYRAVPCTNQCADSVNS